MKYLIMLGLLFVNEKCENLIIDIKINSFSLNFKNKIEYYKCSIYRPVIKQTDTTPLETASMKIIDTNLLNSGNLKWVAISRNLHKRYGGKYDFGDKIKLMNCGKFSNQYYYIQDLMDKRWHNKIDILISSDDTINHYFKKVKIK